MFRDRDTALEEQIRIQSKHQRNFLIYRFIDLTAPILFYYGMRNQEMSLH